MSDMEGIDPRIKDTMWSVGINLAAILISGIKLDSSEWILFNYLQQVFGARWPAEYTKPGGYVWISAGLIREQLAALPDISGVSDATLWRRLKSLEDAGLVVRYENNQKETKCYLAPGPAADQFMPLPISKMKEGYFKNEKGPISKMKDYSNTINSNTNTHSSDSLTPLQGETQEVLKPEKARKVKTLLNRDDATAFYKKELGDSLKDPSPLPQGLIAAAARVKDKDGRELGDRGPIVLADAYRSVVAHMMEPSDMWPDGMWSFVLKKPGQLSFLQFCKLVLDYGMTRASVKEYLDQLQNNKYQGENLYATFVSWKNREFKKPLQNGGNSPAPQQKQGLSQPKQVSQ